MQDVIEQERVDYRSSHNNSAFAGSNDSPGRNGRDNNGFVVAGGPWEQQRAAAPNTASVTDFPAIGSRSEEPPQSSPAPAVWGPRR